MGPTARREQEVGSVIHEDRICGIGFFEPREFTEKPAVGCQTWRVPSGVGHKPIMEQVESTKVLDFEVVSKITSEFGRGEEMTTHCDLPAS